MVRLSESQSKGILEELGIPVPVGETVTTPEAAERAAVDIGGPVVVKAQVSVTKRADRGLIKFADSPAAARRQATEILGRTVDGATVTELRIEEQHDIDTEWYASVVIDTEHNTPRVLFSTVGGTGVETLTEEYPDKIISVAAPIMRDLRSYEAYDVVRQLGVHGESLRAAGDLLASLTTAFRRYDARSVEVNPIAVTSDGDFLALDARISIDDAAVSRHPEIDVGVAREFGRSPTELETIAYRVEEGDYRGTFYFIQTELDVDVVARGENYIGFHGAGGGGSMMSLDAVVRGGFQAPNYTDTSGNPPASKVYKASRIILSQPGIVGYLYSGSGAASQEMYTVARGLMKAFIQEQIDVPAVLRLGGNAEDQAIEVVDAYADQVPAPVEAYGGEHSAGSCVERLRKLVDANREDPERAASMAENAPLTPDDIEFNLDLEDDLAIDGLDEYRARIAERPAVAELLEVPYKWAF